MTPSSAHCSPHQNPPLSSKDELAGAVPIESNNTSIPAILYVYTPTLILAHNLAEQVLKYTNDDLEKATKLALELFYWGH